MWKETGSRTQSQPCPQPFSSTLETEPSDRSRPGKWQTETAKGLHKVHKIWQGVEITQTVCWHISMNNISH